MAKLAKRMAEVEASGIRRVFDLAAKIKNPCNLSIGQPDFDVPAPAKDAAVEAIRAGFNRYTITQGIPELRDGIRAKLKQSRGWEPEDVIITSGVSGALTLAVLAMVDPGDEVLVGDPYYLGYKQLLKLVGAKPVYIDTYPDFRLSPERLERAATPKTKLLFLNSPANPTGAVANEADLKGIAEVCRRRGISVISDEVYDAFSYEGPAASITKFMPEALVLNGFSKAYGMTGWRLGYAAGPKEILREMLKLQQITFVCAPSMTQKGAVAALNLPTESNIAAYRLKRDLIYEGLRGKFDVAKPAGAFYIFPKVPRGTDTEFVERAIAKECLIIPGSVFSERNTHFRISYATSEEQLRRGIDILNALA